MQLHNFKNLTKIDFTKDVFHWRWSGGGIFHHKPHIPFLNYANDWNKYRNAIYFSCFQIRFFDTIHGEQNISSCLSYILLFAAVLLGELFTCKNEFSKSYLNINCVNTSLYYMSCKMQRNLYNVFFLNFPLKNIFLVLTILPLNLYFINSLKWHFCIIFLWLSLT